MTPSAHRALRLGPVTGLLLLLLAACSGSPSIESDPAETTSAQLGGILAGGTIGDQQWRQLTDRAQATVAKVNTTTCRYEASGSAAAISPTTLITNAHVVAHATRVTIETPDGDTMPVASWRAWPGVDIAELTTRVPAFSSYLRITTEAAQPGDLVASLSHPLGGPLQVSRGWILRIHPHRQAGERVPIAETTVDILPGSSGGPLLNTVGEITGIVYAIDLEHDKALALPAELVAATLGRTDAETHVQRECP